jgi:methylglutamate dehydrogenase subunit D
MSEVRTLPLRSAVQEGRFGVMTSTPGAVLSIIHPVFLVSVIAREGKSKAVADMLNSTRSATVMWAGPDQYFVEGVAPADLKTKLGTTASVIDQSHGRVVMLVSGTKARNVLAKGTPVDFHPDHFPIGKSAMTQMAHVGVHLTRTGEDKFKLFIFRGFSESFWEWLTLSAAEFGYQIVCEIRVPVSSNR